MGLLLIHHPGKAETRVGLAARGSTALLGHVDISIDMRHPGGAPLTRRRRLHCLSRFSATPRQLLLELNADATDYLPVAESEAGPDGFQAYLDAFQMVLVGKRAIVNCIVAIHDGPFLAPLSQRGQARSLSPATPACSAQLAQQKNVPSSSTP